MKTKKRITILALFASLIVITSAQAAKQCDIDVVEWAHVVGADDSGPIIIEAGLKPTDPIIAVDTDDSMVGPSFVIFDLPNFKLQALFGLLRVEIERANNGNETSEISIALYDVVDIPLLLQPLWTIAEWEAAKDDLTSGRTYGNFNVRHSPADDGRMIEVPLSYDAMFDINAAAGGMFAIGIANGEEGWSGESAIVQFLSPTDGGVVQLEILNCREKRGRNDKKRNRNDDDSDSDSDSD